MTRLLIARHGNTFGPSDEPRRIGTTDLPLVESGLLQAAALGRYLETRHCIPDVIFTSTLQRTQQTAQAIQEQLQRQIPSQALAMFDEIDYGPDENQKETAVLARLGAQALKDWDTGAIVPQGWRLDPAALIQSWQDFADSLCRDYTDKTCLVVTSNGIARFAPYLTKDFAAFCKKYPIKMATGGLGTFKYLHLQALWQCRDWNVRPGV